MSDEGSISGSDSGSTAVAEAPASEAPPSSAGNQSDGKVLAGALQQSHGTDSRLTTGEPKPLTGKDRYHATAAALSKQDPNDPLRFEKTKAAVEGKTTPPAPTAPVETTSAQPALTAEALGLTDKELKAFQRSKWDLKTLPMVPPGNRKAIAASLLTSQAEADRQFQAAKSGKAPEAAATNDSAAKPQDVTPAAEGQTTQTEKPAATQANPPQEYKFEPFEFPKDDYAALVEQGGEEIAKPLASAVKGLQGHMEKQFQTALAAERQHMITALTPFINAISGVSNHIAERDVNEAMTEVAKTPGLDKLTDAQKEQWKDSAKGFMAVNAQRNPNYRWNNAMTDAAASLFRPNTTQALQQQLLNSSQSALAATPDRGGDRVTEQKTNMSKRERHLAVGHALAAGKSVEEASSIFRSGA